MPVEYRAGEHVTVGEFRERFPGLAFVVEISTELPGYVDHLGRWVIDGFELRELCRDPSAVKRAFDRLCERQEKKHQEALAAYESASRRR